MSSLSSSESSPPKTTPTKSKKKKKKFLSPRRSVRLLKQQNCNTETLINVSSITPPYSSNTSDYGTSSSIHSVNKITGLDLSVLSDDLSNISLIEEEEPILTIKIESFLKTYLITPYTTRKLRSTNLKIEKANYSKLNNLNLNNFNVLNYVKIKSYSYTFDASYPPLLSVLSNDNNDEVYIYFILNGNLKFYKRILVSGLKRITIPIEEFDVEYLFLSRVKNPVTKNIIVKSDCTLFDLVEKPLYEICFPKDCIDVDNFLLSGTVYYDTLIDDYLLEDLAAPMVKLSPMSFKKFVNFKVEILNMKKNVKVFKKNDLIWEEIEFKIIKLNDKNYVTFQVKSFSWFKIVWDVLNSTRNLFVKTAQKIRMKCQATMDEYENEKFGLEISVFNSEKSFPEVQNYSHIVGKSLSKFIQPDGEKLTVCLKSSLFEADTDAGEDQLMVKVEAFKGQDFSKEFALKFKEKVDRGPFGKVQITKSEETVFEFNIQKQGNETDNSKNKNNNDNRWTVVALQELATSLFITDGDNWKRFAKHIGFTKQEIKFKFKDSLDPFHSIITEYTTRGGTPEEFIQKLYEIHREIFVANPSNSPSLSISSRESGVGGSSSMSNRFSSNTSSYKRFLQQNQQNQENSDSSSTTSAKDLRQKTSKKRKQLENVKKSKRRKKCPSTTSSSTSSENNQKTSPTSSTTKKESSDQTKLEPNYLWELSQYMTPTNWKALGRTLQLDESSLINVEQCHKQSGHRECYFQTLLAWREKYPQKCTFGTLYTALIKENMVNVARKMRDVVVPQL